MNEHDRLVDRAAREARTVLFVGGLDAGKSTLARATAAFALRIGRTVAYLDADVAQKLPREEIANLFDMSHHLRHIDSLFTRALEDEDGAA